MAVSSMVVAVTTHSRPGAFWPLRMTGMVSTPMFSGKAKEVSAAAMLATGGKEECKK